MNVGSIFKADTKTKAPLPFYDRGVRAGFPSPANDYMDGKIDFNKDIIRHPAATYYCGVVGDSMQEAGIFDGDYVIIDTAADIRSGDIVLAYYDNAFTVKYVDLNPYTGRVIRLRPANPKYPVFKMKEGDVCKVIGKVIGCIKLF